MDTKVLERAMGTKTLSDSVLKALKDGIRGQVIQPGEPDYDEARKVVNGSIDRYPRLIIQAADVADVILAVNLAADEELDVSVRGGGHNAAGFGTNDGGLVIDLGRLRSVQVDPARQRAQVGGGATIGDLDHATHAFGLATTGGTISTTGVGGLTLGGGIGYLARKYGLSIDNLISADVVTANGRFLRASKEENDDLFWALRGGGGNFGIVTSFEFQLHPVDTIFGGPILYPLEKAKEAMQMYREFMQTAPDNLYAFFAFLIIPPAPPFPESLHMKRVCGVVTCYTGAVEEAREAIKPLRKFGPPLVDGLGLMPYPALQSAFDGLLPKGLQNYWKADFVNELSDGLIEQYLHYGPQVPTIHTAIHIYPIDGAAGRVGKDETAFNYREAKYSPVIATLFPNAADYEKNRQWTRDFYDAIHPYSAGGAYVNFMMDDEPDRVKSSYRDHYPKLVSIKQKYDPHNLFHINQNIKP